MCGFLKIRAFFRIWLVAERRMFGKYGRTERINAEKNRRFKTINEVYSQSVRNDQRRRRRSELGGDQHDRKNYRLW